MILLCTSCLLSNVSNEITLYQCHQVLVESSKVWDTDGDGIIDNGGFADQTFDAWEMTGARYLKSRIV